MPFRNCLNVGMLGLLVCLLPVAAAELPRSPASDTPRPGLVRTPLPPNECEGLPIALVFFDLRGSSGITGGDEEARSKIVKALGVQAGAVFNKQMVGIGLQRVLVLDFVKSASFRIYDSDRAGHIVVALSVDLGPKDRTAGTKGVLQVMATTFPFSTRMNGPCCVCNSMEAWASTLTSTPGSAIRALSLPEVQSHQTRPVEPVPHGSRPAQSMV